MLRFVTLAIAVVLSASEPQSNFVFKDNITPEEAQGYLKNLPFTAPQLSGRTAVLPLVRYDDPRFRSAEAGPTLGHYWKNGKEIQNTEDYVEEVYNAAQYHGQDGLGRYAYGYETPESSKVENREGSGVITGSYEYKSPTPIGNDNLIKVRYWADSQGFHQEDNIPKVELKPAEETPALRDARLAFEKAWHEAAEANKKQPVAPAYPYNNNNNYPQDPYQTQASETQEVVAAAPEGTQAREGKAYAYNEAQSGKYQGSNYQGSYGSQSGQQAGGNYQGSYGGQAQGSYGGQAQGSYGGQAQGSYGGQAQGSYGGQPGQQQLEGKYEEPEPTGPPHGFFYSYTYPVSIIVPKNAQEGNPGYPVDQDTYGIGKQ